eukprot:SAG11_NODE_756_length_7324_cov_13.486505_6_plen_178_part_00
MGLRPPVRFRSQSAKLGNTPLTPHVALKQWGSEADVVCTTSPRTRPSGPGENWPRCEARMDAMNNRNMELAHSSRTPRLPALHLRAAAARSVPTTDSGTRFCCQIIVHRTLLCQSVSCVTFYLCHAEISRPRRLDFGCSASCPRVITRSDIMVPLQAILATSQVRIHAQVPPPPSRS